MRWVGRVGRGGCVDFYVGVHVAGCFRNGFGWLVKQLESVRTCFR